MEGCENVVFVHECYVYVCMGVWVKERVGIDACQYMYDRTVC